jgi:uncharacterized protein (UPF0297 family)
MKQVLKEIWDTIPMKVRYLGFYLLGLLSLCPIWLASCTGVLNRIKKLPKDSIVEEIIEDIIEKESHFAVTLSPIIKDNN